MDNDGKNGLAALLEQLKQERDEVRVKVHLAKMEAEDEWRGIEERWEEFERRMGEVADNTRQTSASFVAASEQLGRELADAFRNFRERL